jgi:hypothetical protein
MNLHGERIKTKGVCPRCLGTGKARAYNRKQKYDQKIRDKCAKLFDKGLTLREIANKLGLNHPQTVKNIMR